MCCYCSDIFIFIAANVHLSVASLLSSVSTGSERDKVVLGLNLQWIHVTLLCNSLAGDHAQGLTGSDASWTSVLVGAWGVAALTRSSKKIHPDHSLPKPNRILRGQETIVAP